MQEGRVIHIEDEAGLRGAVGRQLDIMDRHQVVAEAATLEDAEAVLSGAASGEIDANIVLLDGSLSGGNGWSDALRVTEKIQELGLVVRVVSLSSNDLKANGVPVDASVTKGELLENGFGRLHQVLDELEELDPAA